MTLTAVTLSTSPDSEVITFSLRDKDPNYRYLLRAMVGVDAENLIPKFYGTGLVTGTKFYDYTMDNREIVMRVGVMPVYSQNEDVSDIRDAIYRLIGANRSGFVQVQFWYGAVVKQTISGVVTKMEVPYFSEQPELQITIFCSDPLFRSVAPIEIAPGDLPTANPVRLSDSAGTAPHGLEFAVEFTATTTVFTIQDHPSTPDWKFRLQPANPFLDGDKLYFSNEYANKRLIIDRASGPDEQVADMVLDTSIWPLIFPGLNQLYFLPEANIDFLSISYYSAYWGL